MDVATVPIKSPSPAAHPHQSVQPQRCSPPRPAPGCSSPPDGTDQGCDAEQMIFKMYLIRFASSKACEKCKSAFWRKMKRSLLKQLLSQHM